MNTVIPFYNHLIDILESFQTTNAIIKDAITACDNKIKQYYSRIDDVAHGIFVLFWIQGPNSITTEQINGMVTTFKK